MGFFRVLALLQVSSSREQIARKKRVHEAERC